MYKQLMVTLMLVFTLGVSHAAEFKVNQPLEIKQLPQSKLKVDIESLTLQAQQRALKHLQEVSFPANDVVNMRVSPDGVIAYVDPAPEYIDTQEAEGSYPVLDLDTTFSLHSKPLAGTSIYLDFDGEDLTEGRYWNYQGRNELMLAQPYDVLNNGPEFSQRELEYIYTIWQRVSEDYAPFDVDVTTERPDTLVGNGHVLITNSYYIGADGLEHCIYACGAGGVAWLNRWGQTYFQPALSYYNNLHTTSYIAEVSSHENGHSIGLTHDGTSTAGYFRGQGEGFIKWAPIMGNGYYSNVTTWSIGEYPDANNQQDDMAMIAAKVGYDVDDYPDTIDEAVPTPDHGFIHSETDVDWFYFDVTEEGWLELDVTPSWANMDYTLHLDDRRGSNLDVEVSIVDPEGSVMVFDNPIDTQAQVRQNVDVGRYYIQVTATDSVNYSKYNSMGEYIITNKVLSGNQAPIAVTQKVCPNNYYNSSQLDLVYTASKNKAFTVRMDGVNSYDVDDGFVAGYIWRDSAGTIISTDVTAEIQLKGVGIREYTLFVTDNEGLDSEITTQLIDVQAMPKGKAGKRYKANQRDCL